MKGKISSFKGKGASLLAVMAIVLCVIMAFPFESAFAASDSYVWGSVNGRNMLPDEPIKISVRGYKVKSAYLEIYKFDAVEYYASGNDMWSLRSDKVKTKEFVKKVNVPSRISKNSFDSSVTLDPLAPGAYMVLVKSPQVTNSTEVIWFTVGRLGLITKQCKGELLVHAVNVMTGEPFDNVNIMCRPQSKAEVVNGVTDSNGIWRTSLDDMGNSSMIVGTYDNDVAVMYSSSWWDERENMVYMYTDRPVYRPGQQVSFKGIIRRQAESGYDIPSGQEVAVKVFDSKDNLIYDKTFNVNEWGSFYGDLQLSSEPPLGYYSINATIGDEIHYSSFEVQEYRKPEWSVDVSFDKPVYVTGDEVEFTVQANYYFGSPVADGNVSYRIYRQEMGFIKTEEPQSWDDYDFDSYDYYNYYYGEYVSSGETVLDEGGSARVKFIPADANGKNYRYMVEVDVRDTTDRIASGRANVSVAKGLFDIKLETDRYLVGVDDTVKVNVFTADVDQNVVSEDVDVRIFSRKWTKKGSVDTPIDVKKIETAADGTAVFEFSPSISGNVILMAEGRDERGNLIKAEEYLWVWSSKASSDVSYQENVQVILDRDRYEIGDTASIMVTGPISCTHALFTVEGQRIKRADVIELQNGAAKIDVDITEDMAPNSFVCITMVNDGNMLTDQESLNVSVENKGMVIEITSNKDQYKPGEVATYKVTTKTVDGEPIQAELSFGLVDESIYAIREDNTEDIRRFFYGRKYNSVSTDYSFPKFYYGGTNKDGAEDPVRKYFPDTAAWIPSIVTNERGEATFKVTLPDSLTTWRATVRSHSKDTVVGQNIHKITVTKPVVARLSPPRFYTLGDRGKVVGVVHNYTEAERTFGVHLLADGAKVMDGKSRYVSIPAGGSATVEWEVEPEETGSVFFLMKARSMFLNDAIQLEVPVIPFGDEVTVAGSGELSGTSTSDEKTFEFELNDDIVSGTGSLKVTVSTGYAGIIGKALDYLASYPYGCVEQTMSSFLPDVIAAQMCSSMDLPEFKKGDELEAMVNDGLQRLYNMQHSDGGWGWWEYDSTQPWMTAYVLYGLTVAKDAGFNVSEGAILRGQDYLSRQIVEIASDVVDQLKRYPDKEDNRYGKIKLTAEEFAFCSYVVSMYDERGKSVEDALSMLASNEHTDAKTLAFIALESQNSQDEATASKCLERLKNMCIQTGVSTIWNYSSVSMPWRNETCETTAWAMMAFMESDDAYDENAEMLSQAAHYIASARTGDVWRSTRESAACVFALVKYTQSSGAMESSDRKVTIGLNGKPLGEHSFKASDSSASYVFEVDFDRLKAGNNVISVKKTGTGPIYFTVEAGWYKEADDIKASDNLVKITREYLKVDRNTPIKDKYGVVTYASNPISGNIVNVGDEILVRVTVDSSVPLEYMAFEDPIPSGFEVAQDNKDVYSWNYWYGRQEVRDDRVMFFSYYVDSNQNYVFEYVMTPERQGTFKVMPTKVWSMYYPELVFNGDSFEIEVVAK